MITIIYMSTMLAFVEMSDVPSFVQANSPFELDDGGDDQECRGHVRPDEGAPAECLDCADAGGAPGGGAQQQGELDPGVDECRREDPVPLR